MNDELHVIDTTNSLTREELIELKRLANLSRSARLIFAVAIGAISLFGLDKLVGLLDKQQ